MKMDYADLLSPFSFYLDGIGHICSPKLKDIWNPKVTWKGFQAYLALLLMTPQTYCGQDIPMFDILRSDAPLQAAYTEMFSFFFEEKVLWNDPNQLFFTYQKEKGNSKSVPAGMIHPDNFSEVCDVILQRCGISRKDTDTDTSRVKNRRAVEILKKIQKGRRNTSAPSGQDRDLELPNLIAAVAVKSNSINFTNIWDLTLFQLYEQFKKEQSNVYFDIQKMSVAAYGNNKHSFKGNEWYKKEI